MVKQYYKYKLEFTCNGTTNTTYHKTADCIKNTYGIPKSSLFLIINPNKTTPEKYRHYKCTKVREPIYETTERVLID